MFRNIESGQVPLSDPLSGVLRRFTEKRATVKTATEKIDIGKNSNGIFCNVCRPNFATPITHFGVYSA